MRLSCTLTAAAAVLSCVGQEWQLASAFVTPGGTSFHSSRCSSSLSSTCLFLEPLAKEGDWSAYLDEDNTGLVYYFNAKTGESLWDPPTKTFPPINMSSEKRQVSDQKRQEYKQKTQQSEQKAGGLFSNLVGALAQDSTTVSSISETKQEEAVKAELNEQPNWFDGLFEDKPAKEKVLVEEKTKEQKEEGGFFSNVFGGSSKPEATKEAQKTKSTTAGDSQQRSGSTVNDLLGDIRSKLIMDEPDVVVTAKKPEPVKKRKPETDEVETMFAFPDVMSAFKTKEGVVTEPITIEMASAVMPHPAKISWGGEDAAFTKGRTFGVFDGVSGAEKLDGVPLYSKVLATEMMNLVGDDGLTIKELTTTLTKAAEFADKAATGASTALVASITENGFLRVLNLGDSACLLIRDNAVVRRTKDIVHYFDCPYQLAEDSPDRPKDGTTLNVEVLPGDVILMGSDGVFDNLSDKFICETVASWGGDRPAAVAKRITDLSRKVSLDTEAETPYAKLAKRNGEQDYQSGKGGKVDDTSCIVVRCT